MAAATMISFELQIERHGRLSVFLALVRLRYLMAQYPEASLSELGCVAAAISADYATADWTAAHRLAPAFHDLELHEDPPSMRRFLDRLLVHDQPLWLLTCVRGRAAARSTMPPGVRQCLTFAQVLGGVPDDEAVRWWDRLVGGQREHSNLELKERGRQGERLTLNFETARLREIGITDRPRWMALDDEGLGYDVLSYDRDDDGRLINRMIEVKACSGSRLEIYVTRGEWKLAAAVGHAYRFHVWHLPSQQLAEFSVADLAPHVPQDHGLGTWQQMRIPLGEVGRAKM
jgi:hypothetical protein